MRIKSRLVVALQLFNHLVLSKSAATNIKLYRHLVEVLYPFRTAKLVTRGTSLSYLSPFISRAFNKNTKLCILAYHYSFIHYAFHSSLLKKLFTSGIECYKSTYHQHDIRIVLAHGPGFEYEGLLSLYLIVNNNKVAKLAFSIIPGAQVGINHEKAFYISCLQKMHSTRHDFSMAAKHFQNVHPTMVLLKVLEALGATLGISQCIGISAENQLSCHHQKDYSRFYGMYDELWSDKGGVAYNNDYLITLPMAHKPILSVKQNHRNRVQKKRDELKYIYQLTYQHFSNLHLSKGAPFTSKLYTLTATSHLSPNTMYAG